MSRKRSGDLRRAYERALADHADPVIQSGTVYGDPDCGCYGCGSHGALLFDQYGAWCASCGGAELVDGALDLDYTLPERMACINASSVAHFVASPDAKTTLCFPAARIGRMQPAPRLAGGTCQRCLSARADQGKVAQ